MKIISTAQEIQEILIESIKKYNNVRFAVAWASANHDVFKTLMINKQKIVYSTVGLHFSQTHPSFIKEFINEVKFIKKEKGIFHPKVYLFFNDENNWQCLIGSTNFTKSALSENYEVMTLFSSHDGDLFASIKNILDIYSQEAEFFDEKNLQEYIEDWEKNNKIKVNNDDYKYTGKSKSILNLEWKEYYNKLQEDPYFKERLTLLEKANMYFKQNTFLKLNEEERKNIAGVNKKRDGIRDWRLFGRMPIPRFMGRLTDNDSELVYISGSLDKILQHGQIDKNSYDNFLYYFKTADKDFVDLDSNYKKDAWGYGVSPITRLLAMKRPDEFFCLTAANQNKLMESFKIKNEILKTKDYTRYWAEIIEPIRKSPWYNSQAPADKIELKAWKGRVAMMDAIFL